LAQCSGLSDVAIGRLLEEATHLQVLNLKSCLQVAEKTIHALARPESSLVRLRLNGCRLVTDGMLMDLSQCCRNLIWLDLGYCSGISDDGVVAMAKMNPKLKWIDLSRPRKMPNDLKQCHMGDVAVMTLVDCCPELELLDLSNCCQVTDDGLVHVAEHAIKLKSLSLKSLNRITGKSIMALGELRKRYKRLIWLQIFNCEQINGEVIDRMIDRLNDGWRKGPYDNEVHKSVMNGESWDF
jgi:F-box/leucine-rich repeat protein 2/20